MRITKHSMNKMALATAWLLLGSGAVRADAPGSYFMMFPEGMAVVADTSGKATRANIGEDTAKMLIAGAQPFSNAGIILLYQGKLYIVPDKQLGDGRMMSTMVLSSVSEANK